MQTHCATVFGRSDSMKAFDRLDYLLDHPRVSTPLTLSSLAQEIKSKNFMIILCRFEEVIPVLKVGVG
jgi:hypothetical protein